MKKTMLVCVLLLLAALLVFSACDADKTQSTETGTEAATDVAEVLEYGDTQVDMTTTPVLRLRVNGKYYVTKELTEYLGSDYTWISFPVEMKMLTEGFNEFAVHSNTYSYGNLTDESLDLFFTFADAAYDSYISTNMMSTWELLPDRYADIILELYDGTQWVEYPENTNYTLDANTVTGIYVNSNGIFNSCRVIQIGDPTQYTAARVSVLMHVGSELMKEPEPEPIDEGDGYSELDTTEPVLLVKLNGGPAQRVRLSDYLGQDEVWIPVDLDASYLREGTNRIALDSNVDNTENFSDTSVDLYFSPHRDSTDSEFSTDRRLSWGKYDDHRYANIYIEVHNAQTDEWVRFPEDAEKYRTNREHCVIGQFSAFDWMEYYCERRGFLLTDVAQYDGIRAYIQVHVGSNLTIVSGQ